MGYPVLKEFRSSDCLSNLTIFQKNMLTKAPIYLFISWTISSAYRHIQKIPHAKLVTPNENETKNTEPTPAQLGNMTFRADPRIIGGVETDIKEYPFMANVIKEGKHWCGGSYIAPTWIITAAHCILHPKTVTRISPTGYIIRMGSTMMEATNFPERRAISLVPHPGFNIYNNSCDIGLIEINQPFELSEKIKIVMLPPAFSTYEGQNCTVLGWGITNQDDLNVERYSNHLLKVVVPVVAEKICQQIYSLPKYERLFENHRTICAGYMTGGKDACQGDSGGPMVLNGILVGIVSWGIGCGNEIPGVYTNIYYYKNWIEDSISKIPFVIARSSDAQLTRSVQVSTIMMTTYLCHLTIQFY